MDEQQSLWGAISRAVRTPSRVEDTGQIVTPVTPILAPPGFAFITTEGSSDFDSGKLIAYELGYRVSNGRNLSFDAAAFFNQYDDLRTNEVISPTSIVFGNKAEAESYGVELALDWRPRDWWRLQAAYSWLDVDLDLDADSTDVFATEVEEASYPEQQWSLRSAMNLPRNWELDLWAYYVDKLPVTSPAAATQGIRVGAYTSLNARIAWRPRKDLELSLTGRNLQEPEHLEFVDEGLTPPAEIERSFYGQVRFEF